MNLKSSKGLEHIPNIWFTSDCHWWHTNIIKYCNRPFSSVEEMNEKLVENWNNVVCESDIVYCLGDMVFGGASHWNEILPRLKGCIRLVMGNHCVEHNNLKRSCEHYFDSISMMEYIIIDKQPIYLTHFPLLCYSGSNTGTWNLHGHTHEYEGATGFDIERLKYRMDKQYDVGVDNNNYTPISFKQVKEKLCQHSESENMPH